MKLSAIENSVIESPIAYYVVTIWRQPGAHGETLPTAYKTVNGAINAGCRAIWEDAKSGNSFINVTVRKEDVIKRIPGKLEISSSGVNCNFKLDFIAPDRARVNFIRH